MIILVDSLSYGFTRLYKILIKNPTQVIRGKRLEYTKLVKYGNMPLEFINSNNH